MSSNECMLRINNLSKCYEIYNSPRDRLKQFILPKLFKFFGKAIPNFYREFWALKNISFEVKKGETIGIVGRNGAGKSTLLQIISGTLSPTEGEVLINGRVAALLELGSGFNPEFSGHENIYMSASVLGLKKEEIDQKYNRIVQFADIGDFLHQPVKTYSSGMYVRLAFAVIAHVDADILIVDEALAVGDAFFTQKCMRFLRDFMKSGVVLFVSHDTSSVLSLCSKAIWLDHGRLSLQGEPKSVCELYLQKVYETQQGDSKTAELPQEITSTKFDDLASNSSPTAHDLRIIAVPSDERSFGKGGARVTDVRLTDELGKKLLWIKGGEQVTLKIKAKIFKAFENPIIGFFIKDRLGQMLFGDNTYLNYKDSLLKCSPNEYLNAEFIFIMPWLAAGDYALTVSIASGTQIEHEQQHWIHDALIFRSESNRVCNGLVGIPMLKSSLLIEQV